ncbi:hypothetical protein ABN764_00875 [Paenibacillaceae sp. P-4]|uniref:hypothetical protein n=1 Tax=Paenibacillaceae bacterium P-4 TaxID=3160969 RepID=UPI001580A4E8
MNARSLAFLAVRLGALYWIVTAFLELAKIAAALVNMISSMIHMEVGSENIVITNFVILLLPVLVPLIGGIILWCTAGSLSKALAPSKLRDVTLVKTQDTDVSSSGEKSVLPMRSQTHSANPVLRTTLQIGLGIAGIMLLVNSIPEFIKLLIMLSNQEVALFAERAWTDDSAKFIEVIVQMLLGICLAVGAGGIARFFTRTME